MELNFTLNATTNREKILRLTVLVREVALTLKELPENLYAVLGPDQDTVYEVGAEEATMEARVEETNKFHELGPDDHRFLVVKIPTTGLIEAQHLADVVPDTLLKLGDGGFDENNPNRFIDQAIIWAKQLYEHTPKVVAERPVNYPNPAYVVMDPEHGYLHGMMSDIGLAGFAADILTMIRKIEADDGSALRFGVLPVDTETWEVTKP